MIVVLNGAPRSGKSSIAAAIQESFDGTWMNLGVDVARASTPPKAQPGIGLRPNEPDHPAAPFVPLLYAALWESVAAHERLGLHVAVDVGVYDAAIAADAEQRLAGLPVLWVAVTCPVDVLMERRRATGTPDDRALVERWGDVHRHFSYDLELDTSALSPDECAAEIRRRLDTLPA